jgi:hypothetical protein
LSLVRIFIPTTDGPVAIERITREPAAQSAICVKRTTRVLPISAAYDAFVRAPSGVIEREFGPWDRGAFRLDVSGPITDGESWQLGVFIAHALATENRLAGPDDDVAEALWITGALDSDLGVGAVGHVAEKLHASADLIDQHAKEQTTLRFFVPDNNLKSMAARDDTETTAVSSAKDIQRHLDLLDEPDTPAAVIPAAAPTEAPSGNGLRTLFTVLGISILVAGAGAFIYFDQKPAHETPVATPTKPTPPVAAIAKPAVEPVKTVPEPVKAVQVQPAPKAAPKPKPATAHVPTLKVYELRAAAGGSCAAIQFSDAKPVKRLLKIASGDQLADSNVDGLCGLEFEIAVGPEDRFVSAALNLTRGRFVRNRLPEALKGNLATKGNLRWRAHVPKRLKRPVRYNISVSISKTPISGLAKQTQTLTARHRILP